MYGGRFRTLIDGRRLWAAMNRSGKGRAISKRCLDPLFSTSGMKAPDRARNEVSNLEAICGSSRP